jgi:hypothetical protein
MKGRISANLRVRGIIVRGRDRIYNLSKVDTELELSNHPFLLIISSI